MSGLDREREIFEHAAGLNATDRDAFLRKHCASDESLRARLDVLLAAHDQAGAFMQDPTVDTDPPQQPAISAGATIAGPPSPGLPPGLKRIAGFTLIRRIGEGGMGAVYLAKQDKPEREVALKVVKSGFASASLRRRFELEAEVLGRLQHPGIAQVFEAGMYDTGDGAGGRPYFAMEYIRGEPLDKYVDRHRLGTRDRLTLAAKICDAVQHAHQKGIIHRDLKPGNILVTDDDEPKILDFGVARATDSDIQTSTLRTDIGQLIGTVPYMSPEQVTGDPQELDTRSDVYALGVVIYELLAGKLPYDLEKKLIHEAVRVIREDEPTRLSSVSKVFRGDIETIVAKALEKDKARRYQSANALAMDIRHYLSDEPIAARPASTWYNLRKFARRNKILVGGAAATFLTLGVGLGTTIWQARRANDRANAAERAELEQRRLTVREAAERKRAEGIGGFVTFALRTADPEQRGSTDMTVAQAMRFAVHRLDQGNFKDDPETEAALRDIIGTILLNNGKAADAEPQARRALELRERLFPGDHAAVADSLVNLGAVAAALGKTAEAESVRRRATEMHRRLFPGDDPRKAAGLAGLGLSLREQGRLDEAEDKLVQALDMQRRLQAGDHEELAIAVNNLATLRADQGRLQDAERIFREVLAMSQRLRPGDSPAAATALTNLANVLKNEGKLEDSAEAYTRGLDMQRRLYVGDHRSTSISLGGLATLRLAQGKLDDAQRLNSEALAMRERLGKGDHPDIAESLNNQAAIASALGRAEESESLYRRSLEMYQRLYSGDQPNIAMGLVNVATARLKLGRAADAEPLAIQGLDMGRRLHPVAHPLLVTALNTLAGARQTLGRYAEAEPLFVEALDMCRALHSSDHPVTARALKAVAAVRRDQDKLAEAEPMFVHALEMRQRLYPDGHPEVALSLSDIARLRLDQARLAEAESLYQQALDMTLRFFGARHARVATCQQNLARARLALGQAAEAESILREALVSRRMLAEGDSADVASCLVDLGRSILEQGRATDAEPLFREALEVNRRLRQGDHRTTASGLSHLGLACLEAGSASKAMSLYRESVDMARRIGPREHADIVRGLIGLARCAADLNELDEAEAASAEALGMSERLYTSDHAQRALALGARALVLFRRGHPEQAREMIQQAADMALRIEPPAGPNARRILKIRLQISGQ